MNDIKNIVRGLLYKKSTYKVLKQFTNLYMINNEKKCPKCIIFHMVISHYLYGKMTTICTCCKCKYRWIS